MTDQELIQWLRDNSSGVYRPASQAADRIQALRASLDRIKAILKLPAANRKLMQVAAPARQCLNIINSVSNNHEPEEKQISG